MLTEKEKEANLVLAYILMAALFIGFTTFLWCIFFTDTAIIPRVKTQLENYIDAAATSTKDELKDRISQTEIKFVNDQTVIQFLCTQSKECVEFKRKNDMPAE